MKNLISLLVITVLLFSCKPNNESRKPIDQAKVLQNVTPMQQNLSKYVNVKLTSDVSLLTENERKMLPILIKATHNTRLRMLLNI